MRRKVPDVDKVEGRMFLATLESRFLERAL